jgi:hypothetical protein
MPDELDWTHAVVDIPDEGLTFDRVATAQDRTLIAKALDLMSCESLTTAYSILPSKKGCYLLSGSLQAKLQQACVVTLDPVASTLNETFELAFWPEAEMPAAAGGELDLREEEETCSIVEGRLDIGRVILARLAETLDPFPRAPGATLELPATTPPAGPVEGSTSPFAVLAQRKTRR